MPRPFFMPRPYLQFHLMSSNYLQFHPFSKKRRLAIVKPSSQVLSFPSVIRFPHAHELPPLRGVAIAEKDLTARIVSPSTESIHHIIA